MAERSKDYQRFKILSGKNWDIYLHENQYFLGRVYLWAKRVEALDLMDMTPEEQREFFDLGKKVTRALTSLFNPDLFNYAALGNEAKHLHVHFIPRYESVRQFAGMTFKDKRWGKNYAPYDYDFKISEDKLMEIKSAMRWAMGVKES